MEKEKQKKRKEEAEVFGDFEPVDYLPDDFGRQPSPTPRTFAGRTAKRFRRQKEIEEFCEKERRKQLQSQQLGRREAGRLHRLKCKEQECEARDDYLRRYRLSRRKWPTGSLWSYAESRS